MAAGKDGAKMIRIIGAGMIVISCGGSGFLMAVHYRKEIRLLQQLYDALGFMENELSYRVSTLPRLCADAASYSSGSLKAVLSALASELESQIYPDARSCMQKALENVNELPASVKKLLYRFGNSLGKFDLNGQLDAFRTVKAECEEKIEQLRAQKDIRIRNYQTLGLCAGAALAILLI